MIARLLSVLISLALGFAAIEGFLYLAPSFQATQSPVDRVFCEGGPDYARPSERFGTTEIPGIVFFERQNEAEGWALHVVNDMGFRDVYDDGGVGAIVLGDSFARGTLVSNHESFAGLLDRWQPDIAFHNFGIGGFGTADAYRVYKQVADDIPHRLVVLGYYVGNDVDNNLESDYRLDGGELVYQEPEPSTDEAASKKSLFLKTHVFLSNTLRSYRLFYQLVQQQVSHSGVPSAEADTLFAVGEALTEALLIELADAAANHDADLIAILPDWNEPIDAAAAARAERQRTMIQELTETHERIFAVDVATGMAAFPREDLFGRIDKHYSRLGQHVTAAAIADWLEDGWLKGGGPNAGVEVRPAPAYDPEPDMVIEPDCTLVADYRDRFLKPAE